MNFQDFVDSVAMPCCVLSVRRTPEGGRGDIRILCANWRYRDVMGPAYYDGMPYEELVPRDNKFEDYCFRAAIGGQRMHAYVETKALNCWTDQTLIPLRGDAGRDADGGYTGYCQFIFEFTQSAEAGRMATVSVNTAEIVIQSCIELMRRGEGNFRAGLRKSLGAIVDFAEAKGCRVMLADHKKRQAVNLCECSGDPSWPARPAEEAISYALIRSWEDMIGVSNCVIVQNEREMEELGRSNPAWAESLRANGIRSLVLIPLRRNQTCMWSTSTRRRRWRSRSWWSSCPFSWGLRSPTSC